MLDTSRIESGSFSYRFADVDLGELIHESAAAAESGQDEVKINANVRPAAPADPWRPRAAAAGDHEPDRQRRQVLAGRQPRSRWTPSPTNGRLSVEVRDRGPGVAREHQSLIFEKFGRVSGEHAKPGTGLGLFIARSIADAHGGTLEVHSAPTAGATFTLVLPSVSGSVLRQVRVSAGQSVREDPMRGPCSDFARTDTAT